ncbi:MAG: PEPxxWA-CTERM sorting domain-containing protein [Sphingomonadales bacterium]|jgi:hypothetical protein
MRIMSLTIAATLLCGSTAAYAAAPTPLVYNLSPSVAGNQAYTDNLGLDFTVNSAFTVHKLGAFDDGSNGITADVFVGIWNLDTQAYVTPLVNFNGSTAAAASAYALKGITPVLLTPGHYSVVAYGFDTANLNFNTNISGQNGSSPIVFNSFGGRLSNVQSRYGGGANPSSGSVFGFESAFAGGTLGVPEPGAWAMLIAGMAMVGIAARRRNGMLAA